jgi:SAM-dependent methyltransferase
MNLLARSLSLGGRITPFGSTIFHSCAMGALDLQELRRGIREHWDVLADHEADAVYGLEPWETSIADSRIRAGMSVLLAGCGSGRELVALGERGCRLVGIDPASQALAVARRVLAERSIAAELVEGFVDDIPVPGRFDVVWFGCASYSLIPESARRIAILRRLASQLVYNGVLIVNFQFPLTRPRAVVTSLSRAAGALTRSDWRMEAGDRFGFLNRNGHQSYSYGHAFTLEEFECEAAAAGTRVVDRQMPHDFAVYVLEPIR